jgi:amino-acid N-acetyltransferase
VIGTAGLEIRGEDALLRSAAVDPEWRSRGLGARLTMELLALAEARGIRAVYLLTTTAEGFFPRFGFTPISRADVSPAIADTVEFREACPASAVVMARAMRDCSGAPAT